MKPLRVLLLCLAVNVFSQVAPNGSATANVGAASAGTSKDERAVRVLTQMLAATGWTKQAVPKDAVLSGTITRYFGDNSPSSAFTVKIRGREQYRYEEEGSASLTANGSAGVLAMGDGKKLRIPAHSALSSRGLILPLASILADWNDADVDLTLVGETSINGEACLGIQLARGYPDTDRLAKVRRSLSRTVIWVSTTRGFPLRADYYRAAIDNSTALTLETVLFSDYRTVHNTALPFRQDVYLGNRHLSALQFSSIQFNTGLSDADFVVPAITGGGQ